MNSDSDYRLVLSSYPSDCQPLQVDCLRSAGGFSGSLLWRLETSRGRLCLRRWPLEYPSERLEFIQAVLWHVNQEGFHQVPVPLETQTHAGYVRYADYLWELAPWMPGRADYRLSPNRPKLAAALTSLARFHQAAASFPLPDLRRVVSPGMADRCRRLRELLDGGAAELSTLLSAGQWPELSARGQRILELFGRSAEKMLPELQAATRIEVALQPCIRDVWHDHVLFQGSSVTGLIDFGAMRPENVSADIARLLGSLVADDLAGWQFGLEAYQRVRRLSEGEIQLVTAFDRSTILMSGIQWLDWIYRQGRQFSDRTAVVARLDEILTRLSHLTSTIVQRTS